MGLVSPVAPASSRWLTMSTTLSVRTRRHDDFARLSWGKVHRGLDAQDRPLDGTRFHLRRQSRSPADAHRRRLIYARSVTAAPADAFNNTIARSLLAVAKTSKHSAWDLLAVAYR